MKAAGTLAIAADPNAFKLGMAKSVTEWRTSLEGLDTKSVCALALVLYGPDGTEAKGMWLPPGTAAQDAEDEKPKAKRRH